MKTRFTALLALCALISAPVALAADVTDVGVIDQAAIGSLKSFASANGQLERYKATLNAQFARRMRGTRSAADQQKVIAEFQGKVLARQRELFAPLFGKAQTAIASVVSSRNLSVVVDKGIVVYGGQEITRPVMDLLQSPGDPVPPVSTPPPSSVGYVDQLQIDNVPKIKSVNDEFMKFGNAQKAAAQAKMARAKTDAERQAILKDYQKSVSDKSDALIKPLSEQTRASIADVAKKKNLLLVIDKSNLIFGGTDVTADVVSALNK
ncbi:MAG: hypothetical protein GIW98_03035 [Candidatus Eremiobacteraeota bacterium]|nr:hypothetical protein [Candidatus Eremiobacteraeota bacterium]